MIPPFSSLGRSVASTYPAFAAPVVEQSEMIRGSSPLAGHLMVPSSTVDSMAPVVSRKPRRKTRYLYAYGAQYQSWFRMIATGGVESSKFQPWLSHLFNASFNDGLYEAGYPRNNGWSVKVATVPNELINGGAGPGMVPRPQKRNVIFTRRAYNTVPTLPAKPASS